MKLKVGGRNLIIENETKCLKDETKNLSIELKFRESD